MVKFEYLNLADDKFPSPLNDTNAMDVIFCRNVFIYFTEKLRSQVARGLFKSLLDGGYLVVSASELSLQCLSDFIPVNFPETVLFQKTSKYQRQLQQVPAATSVLTPMVFTMPLNPVAVIEQIEKIEPQLRKSENKILPEPENPLQVHSIYDEALISYAQGNYADVVTMLQYDDQTSTERILLIRAYANLGNLDAALLSCKKAITADKLNPGLHYLYATILQENNLMDEAITSLKRAIFLDSNFVLSHYSLGMIYQRLGNDERAAKCNENVMGILNTCGQDDILFASDGLTAGRFKEILGAAHQRRDRQ